MSEVCPVQLNDLLLARSINPESVLVFRHRPKETALRHVLPWLAAERHDVYNAYQRIHGPKVETALAKADYVASFIGHSAGKALFVGLYRRGELRSVTRDECLAFPEFKALSDFGMHEKRDSFQLFDLERTDFYAHWAGRLVIEWPPRRRAWWGWAADNTIGVSAIHEQSVLSAGMPSWDRLSLGWRELAVLPARWRAALAEWRGIYLIFDASDAKFYVGSASGSNNILGRWLNYAENGHGKNVRLLSRDPSQFRFSILQRVSPDMEAADVVSLENAWKDRLHTREFGLNAN
jgi:GIY-YIG catalytic domain